MEKKPTPSKFDRAANVALNAFMGIGIFVTLLAIIVLITFAP